MTGDSMKVYIAGSWVDREKIKDIMDKMPHGITVTEDWTVHDIFDAPTSMLRSMHGIEEAEVFIMFHDGNETSGKMFELGYAEALNKDIILCNVINPSNIFIRGNMNDKESSWTFLDSEDLIKYLRRKYQCD